MRASAALRAELVIDRAIRADVPAILDLYRADALGGHGDGAAAEHMTEYLVAFDDIARDPNSAVYVARLDGKVVGTFQLSVMRHLLHRGARVANLEAVHVLLSQRRKGVGETMLAFAVDEARRRGCARIQLLSDKVRREASRFYARHGFVASHEGMRLTL